MKKLYTVFQFLFLLLLGCMAFGYLVSRAERGSPLRGAREAILFVGRFPDLANTAITELFSGTPSNYAHRDESCMDILWKEETYIDSNFMLTSFFDQEEGRSKVELIRIADMQPVHEWIPPEAELLQVAKKNNFPNRPTNAKNFVAYHPLLLEDGSLVFGMDYAPLAKIGPDSKLRWVKAGWYHHAIELDAEGNIWTCRNDPYPAKDSLFAFKRKSYEHNVIVQLDTDGNILFERSLDQIFIDNGLEGYLYGAGEFEFDPFHLNDVQAAHTDGEFWKKGDLLLSIRNKSSIALYRPSNDSLLWVRHGDWVNQHDVNFLNDHEISLFGNDVVRTQDEKRNFSLRGYSDLYRIDLRNWEVRRPYTDVFKDQEIYAASQGRGKILPNGLVYVEETQPGRLFIAGPEEVKWRYAACSSAGWKSNFGWCRYIFREQINPQLLGAPPPERMN